VLSIQAVVGDLDAAYAGARTMSDAGRAANDAFTKSLSLDMAGECLHFQSREHEAITVIEEARGLAEEARLGQPLQYVYFDLALVALALGRYDDAFEAARKNIALCERVDDQGFWWCRAKNTLGRIYMELGDLERGARHNQDAVERALTFGDLETLRNAQLNIGDCLLGRGDAGAAREWFSDLETTFAADTGPEWMKWRYTMHLLLGLSQSALAVGDPERAILEADRCIGHAESTRTKRYVAKGRRARGLALSALDRHDEAIAEIERSAVVAGEIGGPEPAWQGQYALARAHRAAGHRAAAGTAATDALIVVEGIVAGLREAGAADTLLASPDVTSLRELAGSS